MAGADNRRDCKSMLPPLYPHASKTAVRSHLAALGISDVPDELLDAAADYLNDGLPFPAVPEVPPSPFPMVGTIRLDANTDKQKLAEKAISRDEVRGFLCDLGYNSDEVDSQTLEAFVAAVNDLDGLSDSELDISKSETELSFVSSDQNSYDAKFRPLSREQSFSFENSEIENAYGSFDESMININSSSSLASRQSVQSFTHHLPPPPQRIRQEKQQQQKIYQTTSRMTDKLATRLSNVHVSKPRAKEEQYNECYFSDAAIQCTIADDSLELQEKQYRKQRIPAIRSAENVVAGRRVNSASSHEIFKEVIRNPADSKRLLASLESYEDFEEPRYKSSHELHESLNYMDAQRPGPSTTLRKEKPSYYSKSNYPQSKKPADLLEKYLAILRQSSADISRPPAVKRPSRKCHYVEKLSARDPVRRYQQYRQVWAASAFLKRQKTKSASALHGSLPI